jgi:hypothetical protein
VSRPRAASSPASRSPNAAHAPGSLTRTARRARSASSSATRASAAIPGAEHEPADGGRGAEQGRARGLLVRDGRGGVGDAIVEGVDHGVDLGDAHLVDRRRA